MSSKAEVKVDEWKLVEEVCALGFPRVCMPKVLATDFRGNIFGCSGVKVLLERLNEGAVFRMILYSGTGGVHLPQADNKILVVEKGPPFTFTFPSTRQWKISSKKLKGEHTLARVVTLEFDEAGDVQKDHLKTVTITIPITEETDQACVFSYGLEWGAKVVAANIAYLELYAATQARHLGRNVSNGGP
jgi:hypothetical protein